MRGSGRALAAVAVLLACLLIRPGGAAAATQAFRIGLADGVYVAPDPGVRTAWLDRSVAAGADIVAVPAAWAAIAPERRTASFRAADPGDPSYRWQVVDAAVRDATARGLDVVLVINRAPRWAEGADRPRSAPAGTWRPDPRALRDFAAAIAQRYSGTFAPPGEGALPRVGHWQVWGEPNLAANLTPQWTRRRSRYSMRSPDHYRRMLNAAYSAIKAARGDNFVVTAGTAPFGDLQPGGRRVAPLAFTRRLLCLDRSLHRVACRAPARFDALAHDPYSVGRPRRRALNADDVSIADLRKLDRALRAAVRQRTVRPSGPKRLWVTEVSWDSSPPDPDGVPLERHARWLEEALFILWKSGVETVLWFQVRDAAPFPTFGSTYQSGIYFEDGTPKPAAYAFRFPLAAERLARSRLRYWGRAPDAGPVTVEGRFGGVWRALARPPVRGDGIFSASLQDVRPSALRATTSAGHSLVWSLR